MLSSWGSRIKARQDPGAAGNPPGKLLQASCRPGPDPPSVRQLSPEERHHCIQPPYLPQRSATLAESAGLSARGRSASDHQAFLAQALQPRVPSVGVHLAPPRFTALKPPMQLPPEIFAYMHAAARALLSELGGGAGASSVRGGGVLSAFAWALCPAMPDAPDRCGAAARRRCRSSPSAAGASRCAHRPWMRACDHCP